MKEREGYTTIAISKELRKLLKVECAKRGLSYEEFLAELIKDVNKDSQTV